MKAVFRCDASTKIGTGHVMRCLTVADLLRIEDGDVFFICRELPGDLIDYVRRKGFIVKPVYSNSVEDTIEILKEVEAQLLIVDHYGIDISWEKMVRPYVEKIMVLDDLANRAHDCDVLLDQNYNKNLDARYNGLIPKHCLKLLGPKYAVLRKEFYQARNNLKERSGAVNRIFVFLGGGDYANQTSKVLKAIQMLDRPNIAVDVVIGDSNPHKEQLKQLCADMPNVALHYQANNMAQLMASADLAIGGGGSTTWERCFLGLPSLVIILAENQRDSTESLSKIGAIKNLGFFNKVNMENILEALKDVINDPSTNRNMSNAALKLMGDVLPVELDFLFNKEMVKI